MIDRTIPTELITKLLNTPPVEEQAVLLSSAGFATPDGLAALLAEAEHRVGVDPYQSQQLALLCETVATSVGQRTILPQSHYLRAQMLASKGDFASARTLLESAQAEFSALGKTQEALRMNVGLMAILGDTGKYQEALDLGAVTLAQIGIVDANGIADEQPAQAMLAALIYQNCGHCYEATGRYDDALAAYLAAKARYEVLGERQRLAEVEGNSGLIYVAIGQVQTGLKLLQDALQTYRAEGLTRFQAEALSNIGEAQLLLGNFVESLRSFEEAEQLLGALGELVDHSILLRMKADVYLALNLHGEAIDTYRTTVSGLEAAGIVFHLAFAFWGMGVALAAQNRLEEAQSALAEAAQRFDGLGNLPMFAAVRLELAALFDQLGEREAARTLANQVLDQVEPHDWMVQKIYAYLRNADFALPDIAAAEALLLAAEPLVNRLGLPALRYRFHQRLGHVRLLQGDEIEAVRYLRLAIDQVEQLRDTLFQERMRASFLTDKVSAYQDLVQLYLNREDGQSLQKAFEIAERAKSRALVDLLSGVIQYRSTQTTDDATVAELQKWQTELNAIYNEMLAGNSDASDNNDENQSRTVDISRVQSRAIELEQAISRSRLRSNPADVPQALPTSQPLHAESFLQSLPPDLILLVYHVVGDEIMAFVCTKGRLHVVRHLANVNEIVKLQMRLQAQWERLRLGASFLQRHLAQLQLSQQRILQTLYHLLLEPVFTLLAQGCNIDANTNSEHLLRNLTIVPHSVLHQIPFHALYDGDRYLIESWAISYAPSATVFALCQQRTFIQTKDALLVGMADPTIPYVANETENVRQRLCEQATSVTLLLNEDATLAKLNQHAHQRSIVHLACHGLFRHDNPMFSALKLFDGWLTAADVAQLDLQGALVTLSACESGRSQVTDGDEILGLTYAFLGSGATSLVVSQWLVQDQVTAALMDRWYRMLWHENDLARSLRAAQLEIMQQYPHPYYWAPFILVGQRFHNR